jgi:hypothetical protein
MPSATLRKIHLRGHKGKRRTSLAKKTKSANARKVEGKASGARGKKFPSLSVENATASEL